MVKLRVRARHDVHEARREKYRVPVTLFFALGCLLSLIYLYISGLPALVSAPFALIILALTGFVISTANGLKGSYGLYILGGKRGIGIIERLGRQKHGYWEQLALWGMLLSFGVISLLIFRRRIKKGSAFFGLASLLLILFIILPNLSLSLGMINIPGISLGTASLNIGLPSNLSGYLLYAIGFIGGFSAFILALLIYGSAGILYSIIIALATISSAHPNTTLLNQQVPGVAPVIPGITIPLISGILSLALLLIVHEFSHGILARRAGLKIKQIGLILFGIVPVGAFVEPDEKKIARLPKNVQDEISIAGVSANFALMVIFFVLTLLLFVYIMPHFFRNAIIVHSTLHGYPAYNVIPSGAVILKWNNMSITNLTGLERAARNDTPYSTVSVLTNKGYFSFRTNSSGRIGVEIAEASVPTKRGFLESAAGFLYSFSALSFLLNFLVAAVNLLAIPSLDGWRIFKNRIRGKTALKAFSLFTIALLVIQALPWIWVR